MAKYVRNTPGYVIYLIMLIISGRSYTGGVPAINMLIRLKSAGAERVCTYLHTCTLSAARVHLREVLSVTLTIKLQVVVVILTPHNAIAPAGQLRAYMFTHALQYGYRYRWPRFQGEHVYASS